eukprot:8562426-Lingulodinium_polyedra.AAC.1
MDRDAHGLESWLGVPAFVWGASWWAGYERSQPGSASGCQAQESWHRLLKQFMRPLRMAMPVFVQRLAEYCTLFAEQLPLDHPVLPDITQEPWPAPVLLNSAKMI